YDWLVPINTSHSIPERKAVAFQFRICWCTPFYTGPDGVRTQMAGHLHINPLHTGGLFGQHFHITDPTILADAEGKINVALPGPGVGRQTQCLLLLLIEGREGGQENDAVELFLQQYFSVFALSQNAVRVRIGPLRSLTAIMHLIPVAECGHRLYPCQDGFVALILAAIVM